MTQRRTLAISVVLAALLAVGLSTFMTPDTGEVPIAPAPIAPPAPPMPAPRTQAVVSPKPSAKEPVERPRVRDHREPTTEPMDAPNQLEPVPMDGPLRVVTAERLEEEMQLPAGLAFAFGSWDDYQISSDRIALINDTLAEPISDKQHRQLITLYTASMDRSAQSVAHYRADLANEKEATSIIRNDLQDFREDVIDITGITEPAYDRIFAPKHVRGAP